MPLSEQSSFRNAYLDSTSNDDAAVSKPLEEQKQLIKIKTSQIKSVKSKKVPSLRSLVTHKNKNVSVQIRESVPPSSAYDQMMQ